MKCSLVMQGIMVTALAMTISPVFAKGTASSLKVEIRNNTNVQLYYKDTDYQNDNVLGIGSHFPVSQGPNSSSVTLLKPEVSGTPYGVHLPIYIGKNYVCNAKLTQAPGSSKGGSKTTGVVTRPSASLKSSTGLELSSSNFNPYNYHCKATVEQKGANGIIFVNIWTSR